MKIIARFLEIHVDGDDELYINFVWPYHCEWNLSFLKSGNT